MRIMARISRMLVGSAMGAWTLAVSCFFLGTAVACGGICEDVVYALLADAVYEDWEKLSPSSGRSATVDFLLANGWEQVQKKEDPRSGFYAAVFFNPKTGETVLAFRGTEPPKLNDWDTNLGNGLGFMTDQYQQAAQFALEMKHKYPNLKLVGHSLGGGLAHYAGLRTKLEVINFNPAAVGAIPMLGIKDEAMKREPIGRSYVVCRDAVNYVNMLTDIVNSGHFLFSQIKNSLLLLDRVVAWTISRQMPGKSAAEQQEILKQVLQYLKDHQFATGGYNRRVGLDQRFIGKEDCEKRGPINSHSMETVISSMRAECPDNSLFPQPIPRLPIPKQPIIIP